MMSIDAFVQMGMFAAVTELPVTTLTNAKMTTAVPILALTYQVHTLVHVTTVTI